MGAPNGCQTLILLTEWWWPLSCNETIVNIERNTEAATEVYM